MASSRYLIKNVSPAISKGSSTTDFLIENGIILSKGSDLSDDKAEILDFKGAFYSDGWVDLRCRLGDPGYEEREDLVSGTNAAAAGGFSDIVCMPDTNPVIQTKGQIDYLLARSANAATRVHPCGAATIDLEGRELADIYDMKQAGAKCFSNADHPFESSGALLRTLLYAKTFGAKIWTHADDLSLSVGGMVNESKTTVWTGLKTSPRMAESTSVQSQIEVAAYAKSPLHFSHISTRESVQLIREAKKRGLPVTCDVSIAHLVFTDEKVSTFDSNYKVVPPLRAEEDKIALLQGINDGTIDAIVSDHHPLNRELKFLEFDYATPGISAFETFYALYNQYLQSTIPLDRFISCITINPRNILELKQPENSPETEACITIFHPDINWEYNRNSSWSKSENSPAFGQTLKGRVLLMISNGKIFHPNKKY